MILQKIQKLIEEAMTQKQTLYFLLGNPAYWIEGTSQKFYKEIKNIFKDYNIKEIETTITSDKIPRTKKGDIILGFSRGCGYWKWLKMRKEPALMIGIACNSDEAGADMYLRNPKDKEGCRTKECLEAHWTLTPQMKQRLLKVAKDRK